MPAASTTTAKSSSVAHRRECGRSERRKLKRSAHAEWDPAARKHDPVDVILASAYRRIAHLVPLKMARMARSPFGFFRGSVALFAADMATLPNTGIQAQMCGDAHVHNLGAFAGPDGRLVFDINDFDESMQGPFEWDLKRLAASLVIAGREAGNSEGVCKNAVSDFAFTYRQRMMTFLEMPAMEVMRYRIHMPTTNSPSAAVLRKAERATPQRSLEHLTTRTRQGGINFLQRPPMLTRVSGQRRKEVLACLDGYRETLAPERRHLFDFYRPRDVAFKVVGTGSVGLYDYVVLFCGNNARDPLFLQIKEEPGSAYSQYLQSPENEMHQGQRVVEGQRRMQTQSDPLLGWTSCHGRQFMVRQLSDHKASINDRDLHGRGLIEYGKICGEVLAKGHARSGDACMLAGYMGTKDSFDEAIVKFAVRYADQTADDFQLFKKAIREGRIKAARNAYL